MNVISYFFNAIEVFDSDRPKHKRFNATRAAKDAWRWGKKHPTAGTIALLAVAFLVLFALLAWGPL
jgi:hypothetical protein